MDTLRAGRVHPLLAPRVHLYAPGAYTPALPRQPLCQCFARPLHVDLIYGDDPVVVRPSPPAGAGHDLYEAGAPQQADRALPARPVLQAELLGERRVRDEEGAVLTADS